MNKQPFRLGTGGDWRGDWDWGLIHGEVAQRKNNIYTFINIYVQTMANHASMAWLL